MTTQVFLPFNATPCLAADQSPLDYYNNWTLSSSSSFHNNNSSNNSSNVHHYHPHHQDHHHADTNSVPTPTSAIKQPPHLLVLYIVSYSIIFMAALIGNTMVVAVVMLRPGMRSVTNLFIANLAVADMLVAVLCIPITLMDNIYYGWPFGEILCKLTPYVQGVSVCASVYNLAAIAVDRYLAICFKPQFRIMRRGACLTLLGIWIFSFILFIPWLVFYTHTKQFLNDQQIELCHPDFPTLEAEKAYFVAAIVVGTYILPLTIVFICYILIARRVWQRPAPGVASSCNVIKRYRIKVIKMLITVVAVFALSWLPLHTIFILIYFGLSTDTQVQSQITNVGVPLAQWLELSNSGMNAIIYCFFSENFRRGFLDLLRCVLRRRRINFKRGGSALPPRRVGRSLSEESTMMGSYVVHKQQPHHPHQHQHHPHQHQHHHHNQHNHHNQQHNHHQQSPGTDNSVSVWQDTRKFLQMCALEKRYVWRRGHLHQDNHRGDSITINNTSITSINCGGSGNGGGGASALSAPSAATATSSSSALVTLSRQSSHHPKWPTLMELSNSHLCDDGHAACREDDCCCVVDTD